jgi:hypothetical protein
MTLVVYISALPTQKGNFECTLPSEELYKNCHPLSLSPGHMSCQCRGCDLNVTLTCHYGLWRPIDGIDLCGNDKLLLIFLCSLQRVFFFFFFYLKVFFFFFFFFSRDFQDFFFFFSSF